MKTQVFSNRTDVFRAHNEGSIIEPSFQRNFSASLLKVAPIQNTSAVFIIWRTDDHSFSVLGVANRPFVKLHKANASAK